MQARITARCKRSSSRSSSSNGRPRVPHPHLDPRCVQSSHPQPRPVRAGALCLCCASASAHLLANHTLAPLESRVTQRPRALACRFYHSGSREFSRCLLLPVIRSEPEKKDVGRIPGSRWGSTSRDKQVKKGLPDLEIIIIIIIQGS